MTDRSSPRFTLLGDPLRTKKTDVYDEVDYPDGFEGLVELFPLAGDTDVTCIKASSGERSITAGSAMLSWRGSVGIDIAGEVMWALNRVDPTCADPALMGLRDHLYRYRAGQG